MKKILTVVLALVLTMALCAPGVCGRREDRRRHADAGPAALEPGRRQHEEAA